MTAIIASGNNRAFVKHNGNYYVVSYTTKTYDPETLIFKSDSKGNIIDWSDVGGARHVELDDVLNNMDEYFYNWR